MVIDHGSIVIVLACVFGLLMALGVGANDLANVLSPTLGSKAITIRQALIIAIIFEFAGALLGGSGVAGTISHGIINTQALEHSPKILAYGMLAVLLAGTTWMALASAFSLPVSITQTIVGAILGFGLIKLGAHAIHWRQIIYIAISWVSSPSIAGVISFLIFLSVQKLILARKNPAQQARRWLPLYLFLTGFILAIITILKSLKHAGFHLNWEQGIGIALLFGIMITTIGMVMISQIKYSPPRAHKTLFSDVEKMFAVVVVFTACAMVYAHGSNDVAVAVGPLAAVISLVRTGEVGHNRDFILWILMLGCSGVVAGLLLYGRKIITTVGSGITTLTPSRAFCATFAAATTVVVSTSTGIPVSTTQTLVGAILGVGMARGIGALDLRVVRNIFMSWMLTIPMGAGLAMGYFYLFHWMLNLN